MFTRQSATAGKQLNDIKTIDKSMERVPDGPRPTVETPPTGMRGAGGATPPPLGAGQARTGTASEGTFSIIGNDLTIVGQGLRIITRGTLQVEGKVEGDVVGNEVIIGEKGHVTGVVSGRTVIMHGEVAGTVRGLTVALKSSARVDGDVVHHHLSVVQGAHLDGRVRRPADTSELQPVLEPTAT